MPDGSLDPAFHRLSTYQIITNDGGFTTAFASVTTVAVLGDGKILVGGGIEAVDGQAVGAGVIRLNTNGGWDRTFLALVPPSVQSLLVEPDGRILAGRNGGVVALNPDGSLDPSFHTEWIGGDVNSLARQPDGKIVVGGYFYTVGQGLPRSGICRLNSDGTLDRDFEAGDTGEVMAVALQADEKILVGGYGGMGGQNCPYLGRLQNDNPNFPGRFEFLSVSNAVTETAGNMVIPVGRYGGSNGTATVTVATGAAGSASPGRDYLPITTNLVFLPGQTLNYFRVPVFDNGIVLALEAFPVQLSQPTGGAVLGSPQATTGYILEADTDIEFPSSVWSQEAAGQAVINVIRAGVTTAAVSASFYALDGSATVPRSTTPRSLGPSPSPREKPTRALSSL